MDSEIMDGKTVDGKVVDSKIIVDKVTMNKYYSAQCLAYMGDAVFELYVRKMLLSDGNRPVNVLNKQARQYVSAAAQAAMYHHIEPLLTQEEQAVMKRGRNLHSYSKAKSANTLAYRHATGLEVLFGYLFVNERHERLAEVFEFCVSIAD